MNYYFLEMKIWKVWLINMVILTMLSYILAYLFYKSLGVNDGFCIFMCLILNSAITTLIYLLRSAYKFNIEANEIEQLAKKATNKEEIYDIWHNRLTSLVDKSFHHTTHSRLRELAVMMRTRYELLPKKGDI
jgi:hypothetical protein